MKMTNFEIYNAARAVAEAFQDDTQYLPIKINFYIQKNKTTLVALAQAIEEARYTIIRNYGIFDEENNQFTIPEENIDTAQKELADLFELEQEVEIYKVNIDSFPDSVTLTTGQMSAIMFMIN